MHLFPIDIIFATRPCQAFPIARTHFAQSLHLAEKCGYILGEALAYLALAKLAQAEEDQAAACSKLRQAAVIGQQIQDAALMEEVKTLQAAWSCDN